MDTLTADDFDQLATDRLHDAQALLAAGRFQGARYVCGYAVEFKLKARICRTHGWTAFPPAVTLAQPLKTHNLSVLLLLSTVRATILDEHGSSWSIAVTWNPEQRYEIAPVTAQDAQTMIEATSALLAVL